MLLIDSVKYKLWTPPNEDEFERVVKEHAKDIFGEQSIYFDRKQKLKSLSGIGSKLDGYVIVFGVSPHWHIVEVELSIHSLYEHIVPQISKFINGIKNPSTQRDMVDALYQEIDGDRFLKVCLEKAIGATETYKFLSDLVSRSPVVTIIIEKRTAELDEAVGALAHSQIKIVEFKTFTREGVGLPVHAHVFEPLYQTPTESVTMMQPGPEIIAAPSQQELVRRRKFLYQNSKLPGVTKTANELLHEHLDKLPKDIQNKVRYADDHPKSRAWAKYVELSQAKGYLTDWTPLTKETVSSWTG